MLFDKNHNNPAEIDPTCKFLLDSKDWIIHINGIEEQFKCCKPYLDPGFYQYFCTKGNFFPKLWELAICNALRQSNYANSLIPTKGIGPDFCLSNILDNKDLYLECVCPNRPESGKEDLIENSSFHVISAENYDGKRVIGLSGVDERIIARYGSSIRDKAKKFREKYENTASHYRVLCVSGARLVQWKKELHNTEVICYASQEFKECILGKSVVYFPQNPEEDSSADFSHMPFSIQKDKTSLICGHPEDLAVFNAIIFSDSLPLMGWRSGKIYTIYYREDTSQEFKNLLDEIFYE